MYTFIRGWVFSNEIANLTVFPNSANCSIKDSISPSLVTLKSKHYVTTGALYSKC